MPEPKNHTLCGFYARAPGGCLSAELGHHRLGDEAEVVEVGQVEHLEVHPGRAGGGVGAEHSGDLAGRAAGAPPAELVGVPADRRRPAEELRLVPPAAQDLGGGEDDGGGIPAGRLAGGPDPVAGRAESIVGMKREVELGRVPGGQFRGAAPAGPADQDGRVRPLDGLGSPGDSFTV